MSKIKKAWQGLASNLPTNSRIAFGRWLGQIGQSPFWRDRVISWYQRQPVDTYIISFPKCGRTWLRLMLGRAFQLHFGLTDSEILQKILELDKLALLHPDIPKIAITHDDDPQWKKPHELVKSKKFYKKYKVIFLVRDPRDVVISNYFEWKKRIVSYSEIVQQKGCLQAYQERIKPYKGELSDYLNEEVGSFDTILEFYNIWADHKKIPQEFLLVRYEQLQKHTETELKRILEFLGINNVSSKVLADAVNYTSFKNMRKMETENSFNSFKLQAVDKSDQESYKTRKGKVGGFTEYLNEDEIANLNQRIADKLSDFYGY